MKNRLFLYFQVVFISYSVLFLLEYFSIGFIMKLIFIQQTMSISVYLLLLILVNPIITYWLSEQIMKKIEKK